MKNDFLLDGLPFLRINHEDYLAYSPYRRVFAIAPLEVFDDSAVKCELRQGGFFDSPNSYDTEDESVKVVLNITKGCNLCCKYCWAGSNQASTCEMSSDVAVRIIRNMVNSKGIEQVHFMGGEPTVNFEAVEAVVTCLSESRTDRRPAYYITTNGVMPEEALEWLIRHGFAFSISWDGLGAAHDAHRPHRSGEGSECEVRSSILKVAKTGLPLRVRMTISKLNLAHLYESVSWLADHNVRFVHIEPVVSAGTGSDFARRWAPNSEEFVDEFFRVTELAEEKNVWVMNSSLANLYTPRDYYCGSLNGQVYHFSPDGSISHCYKVQGFSDKLAADFVVGGYRAEDGSIEINEPRSQDLSSLGVSTYPECDNNPFSNFYSGGCPYRNRLATKSRTGIDQDVRRASELLLRRAILHIYKQALKGKTSALEGYLGFYTNLLSQNAKNDNASIQEPDDSHVIATRTGLSSVKFVPIPIVFDQRVQVDACDMCI